MKLEFQNYPPWNSDDDDDDDTTDDDDDDDDTIDDDLNNNHEDNDDKRAVPQEKLNKQWTEGVLGPLLEPEIFQIFSPEFDLLISFNSTMIFDYHNDRDSGIDGYVEKSVLFCVFS